MLSFVEIPRVLKKIEYYRSCFFWQNDQHKKKCRPIRWTNLCQPKELGSQGKSATIADVLQTNPYNVSFRRSLVGIKLCEWQSLAAKLANVNLVEGNDSFVWGSKKRLFTVNSMYRHMINNDTKVTLKIWCTKISLKIKVFMYYLKRGVILTKDNLSKRLWVGSKLCNFCCNAETIQHLFFECYYPKFIWCT
ncbi:hypothetical protein U9M48_032511, partial [Paspalum notatum var. saurae]